MRKDKMPTGFSGFSWAIAIFCLPILLWPLALTISPNLLKNPRLTESEMTLMSIFLWVYPFCLGGIARIAYRLHASRPRLARNVLLVSTVCFYGFVCYVGSGFN